MEAIGPEWTPGGQNDRFLRAKGCPKGAKMGSKVLQKVIKNGVRI